MMRIKIFRGMNYANVERQVNQFLEENEERIEVVEITWKAFLEHYIMITYRLKK